MNRSILVVLVLLYAAQRATAATWPSCFSGLRATGVVTVQAGSSACSLPFITPSAESSTSTAARLQPVLLLLVQGLRNASLQRPTAVELLPASQQASDGLRLPPGVLCADLQCMQFTAIYESTSSPQWCSTMYLLVQYSWSDLRALCTVGRLC